MSNELKEAAQAVATGFTQWDKSGAIVLSTLRGKVKALQAVLDTLPPENCPDCGKPTPPDSVHTCSPQKPVAWGMLSRGVIVDAICPAEHDKEEGDYTVPLYDRPMRELTDEEIVRIIREYKDAHPDAPTIGAIRAVLEAARKP